MTEPESPSAEERCYCGKHEMPRWCGTYGDLGWTHTRRRCWPDSEHPAHNALLQIAEQARSHVAHEWTEPEEIMLRCALESAFAAGQRSGLERAQKLGAALRAVLVEAPSAHTVKELEPLDPPKKWRGRKHPFSAHGLDLIAAWEALAAAAEPPR